MSGFFVTGSADNNNYVCMICGRRYPSDSLKRNCSHGKPTDEEAKIFAKAEQESISDTEFNVIEGRLNNFDLTQLRDLAKNLKITRANQKGRDRLVAEISKALKDKGSI